MVELWTDDRGGIRWRVELREHAGDRGTTLRLSAADGSRQWLRFDCFEREPHWHLDPDGRDETHPLDPSERPGRGSLREVGPQPARAARAGGPGAPDRPRGRGGSRQRRGTALPARGGAGDAPPTRPARRARHPAALPAPKREVAYLSARRPARMGRGDGLPDRGTDPGRAAPLHRAGRYRLSHRTRRDGPRRGLRRAHAGALRLESGSRAGRDPLRGRAGHVSRARGLCRARRGGDRPAPDLPALPPFGARDRTGPGLEPAGHGRRSSRARSRRAGRCNRAVDPGLHAVQPTQSFGSRLVEERARERSRSSPWPTI